MKVTRIAAFLAVATVSSAQAQQMMIDHNSPAAFPGRPPVKVNESFTVPFSTTGDLPSGGVEQATASARKDLYKTMQQECTALGESFSAECRIASFSITLGRTYVPTGSNGNITTYGASLRSVDATVNYELKIKD